MPVQQYFMLTSQLVVIVFVIMVDSLTCTPSLGDAIVKCGFYFSEGSF